MIEPVAPRVRGPIPLTPDLEPAPATPSFMEAGIAAFQRENATVNVIREFLSWSARRRQKFDPEFYPLEHLSPEDMADPRALYYMRARNLDDLNKMLAAREEQRQWLDTLERDGLRGDALSILAGIADPIALIAGAGVGGVALKGAAMAGLRAGRAGGALMGGTLGASDAATQEAVLQAAQTDREASEAVAAVLGGAVLGGGLGTILARRAPRGRVGPQQQTLRQAVGQEARAVLDSVGAARAESVSTADLDDTRLEGSLGLGSALSTKVGAAWNALPRLLSSPSASMRQMVVRLATGAADLTRGAHRGVAMPQAAESNARWQVDAAAVERHGFEDAAYKAHQAAGGKLDRAEFFGEVDRALRAGDVHPDATVQEAAKVYRSRTYEPTTKQLQELGLLAEDLKVKGAKSYAPRFLKFDKLEREGAEFRKAVEQHLLTEKLDEADAEELADRIYRAAITDASQGRMFRGKVPEGKAGRLQERTLNLPDEVLRPWMETDARRVAEQYTHQVISEMELSRAFGGVEPEKGYADEVEKIKEEYREAMEGEKDLKKRAALQRRRNEDLKALETIFRRIRGTVERKHTTPERLMRTVATYTPMPMLGMVGLSALPDIGAGVLKFGLAPYLRATTQFLGNYKATKREARKMGQMAEGYLNSRAAAMWGVGERDLILDDALGKVERGGQLATRKFFGLTLMNQWTDAMQGVASLAAQNAIFDAARKVAGNQPLTEFERHAMASSGLGRDMLARIADQMEHTHELPGGALTGGIDDWTDGAARTAFKNAVAHDVRASVIEPGAAEKPIWVNSALPGLLWQFKGWGSSATTRILLSGLQRRDAAVLNGLLMMTALGGTTVALRDLASRGEVRERSPQQWAADSIDRAGFLQMLFEANALTTPVFGQSLLGAALGKEPDRLARAEGLLGHVAGPGAQTLQRMVQTVGNAGNVLAGGDFTQGDLRVARRMLPLQNLLYLSWLIDKAEAAIGADLPERRR